MVCSEIWVGCAAWNHFDGGTKKDYYLTPRIQCKYYANDICIKKQNVIK
jgi:hypothetical protein